MVHIKGALSFQRISFFILMGMILAGCYTVSDIQERIPEDARSVISPADGRIFRVQREAFKSSRDYVVREGKKRLHLDELEPFEPEGMMTVTIFLNFYNKHVVLSPIEGQVVKTRYTPGAFYPAFLEKASHENEHHTTVIAGRVTVAVTQVAGVLFRRISSYAQQKDLLRKGDKLGHIKFGSAVILTLPQSCQLQVEEGQRVKVGETTIAVCDEAEK